MFSITSNQSIQNIIYELRCRNNKQSRANNGENASKCPFQFQQIFHVDLQDTSWLRGWMNKPMTFSMKNGFWTNKHFLSQLSLLWAPYTLSDISLGLDHLQIIFVEVLKIGVCWGMSSWLNVFPPIYNFKSVKRKKSLVDKYEEYEG